MLSGASNLASGVDKAFVIIFVISALFLVAITVVMLYFVYRYREKRNPVPTEIEGNNKLEILWTVIPTLLALVMFYYGWKGWIPVRNPPKDAMVITSVARMWSFTFDYPNGKSSNVLYIPQGEPVKLNIVATDILHSVYIPAFRVKQDAIPGKENFLWFISDKPGTYDLFCTEYCGLRHSYMNAEVKVLPLPEFEKWYNDTTDLVAAAEGEGGVKKGLAGARLLENKGCIACHSLDGTKLVGPSFKGIYGEPVVVVSGGKERTVTIDDAYIKTSIYEPDADVVKGYKPGQMISYKSELNEKQIADIIEYLKTLNGK
ncbi:MAG TPA: cytochrome c oxidase subunit II [Bacteroidales bacterium]|nr:cytochrome c oxidase subunit II [Bacteroidales bacterium]HSA44841.1 cytochrome c oxidase subunit II [Bacteroidales bacterium]